MITKKAKDGSKVTQIDIFDLKTTLQSKSGLVIGYLVNETTQHYMLLVGAGVQAYSKADWIKIS